MERNKVHAVLNEARKLSKIGVLHWWEDKGDTIGLLSPWFHRSHMGFPDRSQPSGRPHHITPQIAHLSGASVSMRRS